MNYNELDVNIIIHGQSVKGSTTVSSAKYKIYRTTGLYLIYIYIYIYIYISE